MLGIGNRNGPLKQIAASVDRGQRDMSAMIEDLSPAISKASHLADLGYALTKDLTKEDMKAVASAVNAFVAAFRALADSADANNDGKINTSDLLPLIWGLLLNKE